MEKLRRELAAIERAERIKLGTRLVGRCFEKIDTEDPDGFVDYMLVHTSSNEEGIRCVRLRQIGGRWYDIDLSQHVSAHECTQEISRKDFDAKITEALASVGLTRPA